MQYLDISTAVTMKSAGGLEISALRYIKSEKRF